MQDALEDVVGVEEVLVTFDRREAVVRYDAEVTNVSELEDAVAATGGYIAGLKYGPVPIENDIAALAQRVELPLLHSGAEFDHTGVFVLSHEQVIRTANSVRDSVEVALLRSLSKDDLVLFVSLWSDTGKNLLIDWWSAAELVFQGDSTRKPTDWIPLAEHNEKSGGGSIAGLLVYKNIGTVSAHANFRLKQVGGKQTFETVPIPIND